MATGTIWTTFVRDYTTGRTYNPGDFPVAIPAGHEVAARVVGENTSGRTLLLRITVELRDPAGRVRASRSNVASVDHENFIWSYQSVPVVQLDKGGTWLITGRLEDMGAI